MTVNDGKPLKKIQAAQSLLEEGIKVVTGGHPLGLLDEDFAVMVKNQESLIQSDGRKSA